MWAMTLAPVQTGVANSAKLRWRRWLKRLWRVLWVWNEKGTAYAFTRALVHFNPTGTNYRSWIEQNEVLSQADRTAIAERISSLPKQHTVSFVVTSDASTEVLARTIRSLASQIYSNWELHIVCADGNAQKALHQQSSVDARIKLEVVKGGLSASVNAAVDRAVGEFISFLDPGDELAETALYLALETIRRKPDTNILYSDDDSIGSDGQRIAPRFKTDWNLDLFLAEDYFGRLTLYRRSRLPQPPFRDGLNGCEEYDLALRMVEGVPASSIAHVPFVLAHREPRQAPPAADAARMRVVGEHFQRQGVAVRVEGDGSQIRIRRQLPATPPKVSIIIPTRDGVEFLKGCIDSIVGRTDYPDFEIVVVDNQSGDPAALSYLQGLAAGGRVRVLRFDRPFNYSAINNFAATHCSGSVLAFLNNDIVVISPDWLSEMVGHVLRRDVGAVGAMLYYPDDIVQHAGIILGFGGLAANCMVGLKRGAPGYVNRATTVQNYSAVTAACMLTRADVFAAVGGFDEALPVAFNDVDFCLRLRERGYLVTWTPYAELYHLESVTRGDDMAPDKIERFRRDQAYVLARWSAVITADPYYNPNLSLDGKQFSLAARPRVSKPWLRQDRSAV